MLGQSFTLSVPTPAVLEDQLSIRRNAWCIRARTRMPTTSFTRVSNRSNKSAFIEGFGLPASHE